MDKNNWNNYSRRSWSSRPCAQDYNDVAVKRLINSLLESNLALCRGKVIIRHANLTQRERQILNLIMAGLSNKRIGQMLDICESTVKVHVKNLLRKLNVTNRFEAALVSMADILAADDNN